MSDKGASRAPGALDALTASSKRKNVLLAVHEVKNRRRPLAFPAEHPRFARFIMLAFLTAVFPQNREKPYQQRRHVLVPNTTRKKKCLTLASGETAALERPSQSNQGRREWCSSLFPPCPADRPIDLAGSSDTSPQETAAASRSAQTFSQEVASRLSLVGCATSLRLYRMVPRPACPMTLGSFSRLLETLLARADRSSGGVTIESQQ